MNHAGCRPGLAFLAAILVTGSPLRAARADDTTELRDYVVFVDEKEAGQSHLKMVVKADGSTAVEATAEIKVQLLIFNAFSYNVRSSETWTKDGRLVELRSSATENGKRTDVEVSATGDQLRLRINGKNANALRNDVWTSSYWKLADAKYHNKAVPILDADTGKEYAGQLTYVGTEKIKAGAGLEDCYHFRVTGIPVPIELWFDRFHRLVRQEFTESGHRTIVQLIAVRR